MILTTKGRYAVMAVVDLAQHIECDKPAKMQEIASRQEISLNYLEQIFNKLKHARIITAVRGPSGGYFLSKKAETLYVSEVIAAVAEPIKFTRCQSEASCLGNSSKCKTHILWRGLESRVEDYLANITIADICKGKLKKDERT